MELSPRENYWLFLRYEEEPKVWWISPRSQAVGSLPCGWSLEFLRKPSSQMLACPSGRGNSGLSRFPLHASDG